MGGRCHVLVGTIRRVYEKSRKGGCARREEEKRGCSDGLHNFHNDAVGEEAERKGGGENLRPKVGVKRFSTVHSVGIVT